MDFKFTIPQQMLFELLKLSLNGKGAVVDCSANKIVERQDLHPQAMRQEMDLLSQAGEKEWDECYKLACAQGVMAIAWGGVEKLSGVQKEKLSGDKRDRLLGENREIEVPRGVRLKWGLAVEAYKENYNRYCKCVAELREFYRKHGIVTVQLKGVGFSSYYPVPEYRQGGDIDIYTFSADEKVLSHSEANALADELIRKSGLDVDTFSSKHSIFYYKGIPIENHKHFVNTESYRLAVVIEKALNRVFCTRTVSLYNGKYAVSIPSDEFNTMFISFHALQHYGSGITLHHLCDWACLLNKCSLNLPKEITDKYYIRSVAALTYLSNELLGTEVDIDGFVKSQMKGVDNKGNGTMEFVLSSYKEVAYHLLYDMLYSSFVKEVPVTGAFNIVVFKAKRLWKRLGYIEEVMGEPRITGVMKSIITHLKFPGLVFKR